MFSPIVKIDATTKKEIIFCDECLKEIVDGVITCTRKGFEHKECNRRKVDIYNHGVQIGLMKCLRN